MYQINNHVDLTGRLVRDPEVDFIGSLETSKTTFTIAVDRPKKKGQSKAEADFIPCVVWGKSGETVCNYFQKGSKIRVAGRFTTGNYTKKDGTKAYTYGVTVDNWDFCESKRDSQRSSSGYEAGAFSGKDYEEVEVPF